MPVEQQHVLSRAEWEELKQKQEISEIVPKAGGSDLRGLLLRPFKVSFATQNAGEQVFILLRRHWISNVGWIMNAAVSAVFPFIVIVVFNLLSIDIWQLVGANLAMIVLGSYYSMVLGGVIRKLADWYYNLYLVTNERVIDYDFNVLTTSSGASETALGGVEDVKEDSIGFLPTMFNFGDVKIFSAADKNVITFHQVPDPTFVRDKVADLAKIAKQHELN